MTGERINHKSKGLSPLIFSESVDLTSENVSHLLVIEPILLYKSKQINYNDFLTKKTYRNWYVYFINLIIMPVPKIIAARVKINGKASLYVKFCFVIVLIVD
ncbi:hypothetical protein VAFE106499_05265 [Vagococcus fessus]